MRYQKISVEKTSDMTIWLTCNVPSELFVAVIVARETYGIQVATERFCRVLSWSLIKAKLPQYFSKQAIPGRNAREKWTTYTSLGGSKLPGRFHPRLPFGASDGRER